MASVDVGVPYSIIHQFQVAGHRSQSVLIVEDPRPASGGAVALGTSDPRPPDFGGLVPAGTGPWDSQRGLRRGAPATPASPGAYLWGPEPRSKIETSKPATPPQRPAAGPPWGGQGAAKGGTPRLRLLLASALVQGSMGSWSWSLIPRSRAGRCPPSSVPSGVHSDLQC